jgi:hypothetical protein
LPLLWVVFSLHGCVTTLDSTVWCMLFSKSRGYFPKNLCGADCLWAVVCEKNAGLDFGSRANFIEEQAKCPCPAKWPCLKILLSTKSMWHNWFLFWFVEKLMNVLLLV